MTIQQLNLRQKIGQLFITTIDDNQINGETINLLTQFHPGGVLLTQNNMIQPKQIYALVRELQSYSGKQLPLFIAVQAENALKGMTNVPSQQLLGSVNNRLYTKQAAAINGKEWYALGINMHLGPGLHPDSTDSFSEDLQQIAYHGRAAMEGLHKNNILSVATHLLNNNEHIPTEKPLYKSNVHPYLYAIEHGLEAVMTSNIDEAVPFLREAVHFDGLIIYEPTNEAINNNIINAIKNGSDMILPRSPYKTQLQLMESVYQAVQNGEIPEENIHRAVDRILTIKQKVYSETPAFNRDDFLEPFSVRFMKQLEEKQSLTN